MVALLKPRSANTARAASRISLVRNSSRTSFFVFPRTGIELRIQSTDCTVNEGMSKREPQEWGCGSGAFVNRSLMGISQIGVELERLLQSVDRCVKLSTECDSSMAKSLVNKV